MRLLSTEASAQVSGPITAASDRFHPFDPDYLQDPYPTLAALRGSEPVFFSPELGSWVVTRHETIKAMLRDVKRYLALIVSDPLKPLCPHARELIPPPTSTSTCTAWCLTARTGAPTVSRCLSKCPRPAMKRCRRCCKGSLPA